MTSKVDWRLRGACARLGIDPDLFFDHDREAEAAKICAACLVATDCLAFARRTGQRHGFWGGLTQEQLRQDTCTTPSQRAMLTNRLVILTVRREALADRLIAGQKKCPACGETKPLTGFGKETSKPDGRTSRCKTCRAADARQARARGGTAGRLGKSNGTEDAS
jgi:WhiB family transcriptional regulator, redox-sensing transcriptional regulator